MCEFHFWYVFWVGSKYGGKIQNFQNFYFKILTHKTVMKDYDPGIQKERRGDQGVGCRSQ